MLARIPGFLPCFLFIGCKGALQAFGRTRAPVIGVVAANVVNFVLCFGLVAPVMAAPLLGAIF